MTYKRKHKYILLDHIRACNLPVIQFYLPWLDFFTKLVISIHKGKKLTKR